MHTFNNRLHQLASPEDLEDWKAEIEGFGWNTSSDPWEFSMFHNHIGREFNKKCMLFNNQELMFSPYDAGLRPFISEIPDHPNFHIEGINGDHIETIDGSHLILI